MYSEVIYGPPGTGKSTYLVSKVNELLGRGVPPEDIVLCSFTKNAAEELKTKMNQDDIKASTIHSLAFSTIGMVRDQVVMGRKLAEFSQLIKVPISDTDQLITLAKSSLGDEYLALYNYSKNTDTGLRDVYLNSKQPENIRHFNYFCEGYRKWKEIKGYKDFNDILADAYESLNTLDKSYFIIDEAQDLTPLQWKLIDKWVQTAKEVYLAGDDDQAIYTWAGADPIGMQSFQEKYTSKQVVLGQSNRISRAIHRLAERLIGQVGQRVPKEYTPNAVEGSVWVHDSIYGLTFEQDEECLILYRNHSLRKNIEDLLIQKGLPYTVLSGQKGLFEGVKSNFIRLWSKLQEGQEELKRSEEKILKKVMGSRYTGPDCLRGYMERHWSMVGDFSPEELSYFHRIDKGVGLFYKPTLKLNTIHGSKGSESERVILLNSMTSTTMETLISDRDSEIRVFYVGVTRAKNRLDLVMEKNGLEFLR